MDTETIRERAVEARDDFAKASNRMILFGSALVVIHLLNIAPSEVEALGAKVVLPNPIILRGVLAILFLHFFHGFVYGARLVTTYRSINEASLRLTRFAMKRYRKQGRPWKTRKLMTKAHLAAWDIAFAPYFIVITALLAAAIVISVLDLIRFVEYCYAHTPAGLFVRDVLTNDF